MIWHNFRSGPAAAHRHPNGGGWVADSAIVHPTAYIGPQAKVSDKVTVGEYSRVENGVELCWDTFVPDFNRVFVEGEYYTYESLRKTFDFGNGPVPARRHENGGGWVADTAYVSDDTYVAKNARVFGKAIVYGSVLDYASVYGTSYVSPTAKVSGRATVWERARIEDYAEVVGNSNVRGDVKIGGMVVVKRDLNGNVTIKSPTKWVLQ